MRLHKYIAQTGRLSRRKAEEAIAAGRVQVDGVLITTAGHVVDPAIVQVRVDGEKITLPQSTLTVLFHKPWGVVTTKSDDQGRKTVMDYFQDQPALNPVGRLDQESEGLLILTTDGDLALKLSHPRYEVQKTYQVEVSPKGLQVGIRPSLAQAPSRDVIEQLCVTGVTLSDGVGHFLSCRSDAANPFTFEVVVSEGRNRFIRRMFDAVDFVVIRLIRTHQGLFQLSDLPVGQSMVADPALIQQIKQLIPKPKL